MNQENIPLAIACNPDEYIDEIKEDLKKGTFDDLVRYMAEYEIPIGVLSSILRLTEFKIKFIIDDSGSMSAPTDQIRNGKKLTRFEEVHEILLILVKILSFVDVDIEISFLNNSKIILLKRGYNFEETVKLIDQEFRKGPNGGTPIFKHLSNAFNNYEATAVYLFTDGEPSDSSVDDVYNLIKHRKQPKKYPLTLVSCTSDDSAIEWMKNIDEEAMYVAEVDDFQSEKQEVLTKQGPVFPYTRGIWLMCILTGAICPNDLDNLDESKPLTKYLLEHLLGRKVSEKEYHKYFYSGISRNEYNYDDFLKMKTIEGSGKFTSVQVIDNVNKNVIKPVNKKIKLCSIQ